MAKEKFVKMLATKDVFHESQTVPKYVAGQTYDIAESMVDFWRIRGLIEKEDEGPIAHAQPAKPVETSTPVDTPDTPVESPVVVEPLPVEKVDPPVEKKSTKDKK